MQRDEIRSWVCPTWHPEWGDPSVELKMLQDFCSELQAQAPNCKFVLEHPEPGYMFVMIERNGGEIAEVNIVEVGSCCRYGVFSYNTVEDHEFYFDDIQEGCREFLQRFISS